MLIDSPEQRSRTRAAPGAGRLSAVIVPAGTDLNRGDQALIWEADALMREAGFDEIGMIGESSGRSGDGSQMPQSLARGYRVLPTLLDSPRRNRHQRADCLEDGIVSRAHLVAHSLLGLAGSAAILLLAPYPRLARWLVSAGRRRTYDALRGATVVVVKGGGFLHGYGGLRAPYYIWFQLFYLRLAQRLRKPVIVLPNSFGPFEGWTVKWQVRRVLARCRIVTARESISAAVLGRLLGEIVPVLPDFGYFLQAAPHQVGEEACRRAGVPLGERACVAFTLRPWRFPGRGAPDAHFARYLDAHAALVRHVSRQGFHPVLVTHVLGPGAHEDDRFALDALEPRLEGVAYSRIEHPGDCRDLKSIYGCMDYVVGTRFHSVIFAQGAGVPCLAVAYGGNKAFGIMADCGLADYVVPIEDVTPDGLCRRFDRLVGTAGAVREAMRIWQRWAAEQRTELCRLLATLETLVPAGERGPADPLRRDADHASTAVPR